MILKNLSPSKKFLKMGHDVIFFNFTVYGCFSSSEIYGMYFYWLDMMVFTTYNDPCSEQFLCISDLTEARSEARKKCVFKTPVKHLSMHS